MSNLIKNNRRIFINSDGYLTAAIAILQNNVYKITYYEIISGASGTLTIPTGSTINAGEFSGANCVLSEIDGSNKPTFVTPLTGGGSPVTATLNTGTGAWLKSGVTASTNVALIYSVNITAADYQNLTNFYIIDNVLLSNFSQVLNSSALNSTTSSQLAGVISDETGSGALVFGTSPTFITNITTPQITGVSGNLTLTNAIQSSGAITQFSFTNVANTNQTATSNIPNFRINGANKQWATGTVANQYFNYLTANTVSAVGASTFTNVYGLFVEAATAGTNATITNNYAAGFSGSVLIKDGGSPTIELRERVGTVGTANAIYMHGTTPTVNNFNFAATSTALTMNVTPGGSILIQTGTYTQVSLTNTTQTYATPTGIAGGAYQSFIFNKGNHTNQTASTPIVGINWNLGTRQWATGNITTQKEFELTAPTYSFVGASTITSSYTMFVNAPVAGTNATITNNYALGLAGSLKINDTFNIVFDTTTGTKIGTATTQKIGFWNATPIVQPTTAVAAATVASPGAGSVIKTDDTFDGYTLQQIVKALRNTGLLA